MMLILGASECGERAVRNRLRVCLAVSFVVLKICAFERQALTQSQISITKARPPKAHCLTPDHFRWSCGQKKLKQQDLLVASPEFTDFDLHQCFGRDLNGTRL
ncbi:MAG: hypothetical protein NDI61_05635, partial [Bdellovibrionaceae bacterium]|nr:hypothetical protein [Pseudobdellovibrionaceae bacterium]